MEKAKKKEVDLAGLRKALEESISNKDPEDNGLPEKEEKPRKGLRQIERLFATLKFIG